MCEGDEPRVDGWGGSDSFANERMSDLATTMLAAAGALAALMLCAWLVSLRLRDVSIVDPVWGLGFVLVAWVAFALGDGDAGRRLLIALLTSVWGLRLAAHLVARKLREPGEDFRYASMRRRHGTSFALRSLITIFFLQGALVWVVSLSLQGGATGERALGALDLLGAGVWAVGLAFEAIGDLQLTRFRADPASGGAVMDRGLWRYTRHPNYFGDLTVWWGLYVIALAGGAWWSIVSPLTMSLLLLRVSGKEHLERSLRKRRPGYDAYVARTSGFVPLPPRRS
jgi:steroid 5-alpha reductase family enzyme